MKYRYTLKKRTPALKLWGGFSLPEIESEVKMNHPPLYLINQEIEPIGVLWLEIIDNQTGEVIYRWPK